MHDAGDGGAVIPPHQKKSSRWSWGGPAGGALDHHYKEPTSAGRPTHSLAAPVQRTLPSASTVWPCLLALRVQSRTRRRVSRTVLRESDFKQSNGASVSIGLARTSFASSQRFRLSPHKPAQAPLTNRYHPPKDT